MGLHGKLLVLVDGVDVVLQLPPREECVVVLIRMFLRQTCGLMYRLRLNSREIFSMEGGTFLLELKTINSGELYDKVRYEEAEVRAVEKRQSEIIPEYIHLYLRR